MIETVYLENYKCYGPNGAKFDLKPLTFLYGTNGAGKSTFLDGVLRLKEWERSKKEEVWLSADDVFKKDDTLTVGIGVTLSTDSGPIKLFKRTAAKQREWVIVSDKIEPLLEGSARKQALNDFLNMRHMRASRPIGSVAKDTQSSSLTDLQQPDEAVMNGTKAVDNAEKINCMLDQVGLGDFKYVSRQSLKDGLFDVDIPWRGTGAGVHNIAFVFEQIASLMPNGILLLEEPETHLDPRYLGAFARVLVDAIHARKGSQIIMECHSEHLMLAVKGLIRMKVLSSLEVTAIHVRRTPNGAVTTQIPLAEDGTFIQEWPDGGFYQERWELITMGAQ